MAKTTDTETLPPPPGLKFAEEIMTPAEEAALIALIDDSGLIQFALDPTNPRSTKTFGWVYENSDDTIWLGEPLPDGFHSVRDRAAAFAGVSPEALIECMLIRYEPGAVIQPHVDKPAWDVVMGISLGAATTMDFRKSLGGDL
jgi:alkylated DNA repair dioxygenase AlkB